MSINHNSNHCIKWLSIYNESNIDADAKEALLIIAGIYEGSINPIELPDGDLGITGKFNLTNQNICYYATVYLNADTDGKDGVTKQEAEILLASVLKKYAVPVPCVLEESPQN